MAAKLPSDPKSAADQNVAPMMFEEKLQLFWQQNRMIVLALCALVLVAILGKGGWDAYQRNQERDTEAAYAAADTTAKLQAFAAAHPDHALAGVANLRIADEAYQAEKSADALAAYQKAAAILKTGPLATRARMGEALAKIQSGNTTEGIADLKQIAGDTSLLKIARSEATYQLASLAADSGNTAEVQKYVDQLDQIDPASPWARRAMMLRASLPAAPAAAPAAGEKKDNAGPNLQINLPKK